MSDTIDPKVLADEVVRQVRDALPKQEADDEDLDKLPKWARTRISQYAGKTREMAERLQQIEAAAKTMTTEHESALARTRADSEAALQAERERIAAEHAQEIARIRAVGLEDVALSDLGVRDDLGRDTVRAAWQRLPETDRGESAAQWWSQQVDAVKAHAADPKAHKAPEVPLALQPYLRMMEQGGRPAPDTERGVVNRAASPEMPTPDQIRKMSLPELMEFQRTWTRKA